MCSRIVRKHQIQRMNNHWRRAAGIFLLAATLVAWPIAAWAAPWSFGVVADTQWNVSDDGQSPNSVPAGIIRQINREFIRYDVRFVVAVGDIVDKSKKDNIDARALYVQDLYNAGIAFYPLRGNHEAAWGGPNGSGPEFQHVFPQTQNGVNNATPTFAANLGVDSHIAPDPKTRADTFVVGSNFSSPDLVCNGVPKAGLTYSFDYNDARCILLDQWDDSGSTSASTIAQQQGWIEARLADPDRPRHTFVFGHKNLLGARNKNNLLGNNIGGEDPGDGSGVDAEKLTVPQRAALAAKQAAENTFIGSLVNHDVRLYISGHDHLHYCSIVTSPDGSAKVRQLIGQSASSKFHWPMPPVSANEVAISQDINKVGFYLGIVDGPRITFHYYGAPVEPVNHVIAKTPDLAGKWEKLETFGYSLNGREFLVSEGQPYSIVQDSTAKAIAAGETGYLDTTAGILAGTNGRSSKTSAGKSLARAVNTGWSPAEKDKTTSDVLTLWGMSNVGDAQPDTYVLSLSFHADDLSEQQLRSGQIALAIKNEKGVWGNAVDANLGGTKQFVFREYDPSDALGTYGISKATHTAWAVLNGSGDFAVAAIPSQPASTNRSK